MTTCPVCGQKTNKRRRTIDQNSYLWGVVYKTILEQAGDNLAGWHRSDLHEYFLGEHYGWKVIKGFGKKRMKPVERSSTQGVVDFSEYIGFIQQKAAEMGIVIPDPDET